MLIIGIDPGLKGAVAFLKKGKIINLFEMPIMSEGKKNKNHFFGAKWTLFRVLAGTGGFFGENTEMEAFSGQLILSRGLLYFFGTFSGQLILSRGLLYFLATFSGQWTLSRG